MNSAGLPLRAPATGLTRRVRAASQAPPRQGVASIAWSGIGAFTGVYLVGIVGPWLRIAQLDGHFLIGSFGATAVLVYGAPAAEFSQPRNVVGGHVVSACVGVFVAQLASGLGVGLESAAAVAVALAIMAMHVSRTLHPPGGATALIAVIGSPAIQAMGYRYVLCPVLVGALLMLGVALLVNNAPRAPHRGYPRYWY